MESLIFLKKKKRWVEVYVMRRILLPRYRHPAASEPCGARGSDALAGSGGRDCQPVGAEASADSRGVGVAVVGARAHVERRGS